MTTKEAPFPFLLSFLTPPSSHSHYSIMLFISYHCDELAPSHDREWKETERPFLQRHQQANGVGQKKKDVKTIGITRPRLHIKASSFVNTLLNLFHAEKKSVAGDCQENCATKKSTGRCRRERN